MTPAEIDALDQVFARRHRSIADNDRFLEALWDSFRPLLDAARREARLREALEKLAAGFQQTSAASASMSPIRSVSYGNAAKKLREALAETAPAEGSVVISRVELEQIRAERDEARDWVRRMTAETQTLTCVYCGHAYPPGTPTHGADVLTAHIDVCDKHPMHARRVQLAEALGMMHEPCTGGAWPASWDALIEAVEALAETEGKP